MEKLILPVTFRYNKKFDVVEMFYYGVRKDLHCFCFKEGHNSCNYSYYLYTKPITQDSPSELLKTMDKMVEYYTQSHDNIELKIQQRLTWRKPNENNQ